MKKIIAYGLALAFIFGALYLLGTFDGKPNWKEPPGAVSIDDVDTLKANEQLMYKATGENNDSVFTFFVPKTTPHEHSVEEHFNLTDTSHEVVVWCHSGTKRHVELHSFDTKKEDMNGEYWKPGDNALKVKFKWLTAPRQKAAAFARTPHILERLNRITIVYTY